MSYTDISTVRQASGFNDDTLISDTVITSYITAADSTIDSAIRQIYSLPLSETPDLIAMIALRLTIGLIYANEFGEESQATDKGWTKHINFATQHLDKIIDQKLQLLDSDGAELARSTLRQPVSSFTDADSEAGETNAPRITTLDDY